jgi:PST family polysaccharide transporter
LLSTLRETYERPAVRKFVLNLGWLLGEKLMRLVFNLLVGFWVARYLGPGRFGQLNYALALVSVGLALTECGVEAVVKRELIGAPERGVALLRAAWQLRLLLGAGCYLLLMGWTVLGLADADDRAILAVAGLMLFQPALAVGDLWLQATLRARTAVLAQAGMLAAGALGRVILIEMGAPVWAFAAISAGEFLLAAMLLTALARRLGLRWDAPDQNGRRARDLFREAWPMMVSSLAVIIYMRIDVVMLRSMKGDAAAGVYAAAVKLSEVWYFLPVALGSSLLPALLRARAAGRAAYGVRLQQYFDLSAAIAYGLSVPCAVLAPWLVRLVYGASFADAGPVLALHVWGAVFAFIGVARAHFLFNESLGRLHLIATASGAALNIGLNWLLIPRHGPWGAALATVLAQAFVTWGLSFCFEATRWVAGMQTRALLLPFTFFRYVRRAH